MRGQRSDFPTNSKRDTYQLLKELGAKYPEQIDMKRLGDVGSSKLLGWGGEGFVYGYGYGRVLKVNLNLYNTWREAKREIEGVMRVIRREGNESIATVYNWGFLRERVWYIEMEKLKPLSSEDVEAFKRYDEYYKVRENWSDIDRLKPRSESGRRMKELMIGLRRFPGQHIDFLSFNVMKSGRTGRWKAVDLESFYLH